MEIIQGGKAGVLLQAYFYPSPVLIKEPAPTLGESSLPFTDEKTYLFSNREEGFCPQTSTHTKIMTSKIFTLDFDDAIEYMLRVHFTHFPYLNL